MTPCLPAVFTTAIFTALFALDLITKNYRDIGFHIAGGIFSVLGIYVACEVAGETVAWMLLAIPFVFLIIGLGIIWSDSAKDPVVPPAPPTPINCPCPRCYRCPCRCRSSCGNSVTPPPPPSPPEYVSPPSPFECPKKTA